MGIFNLSDEDGATKVFNVGEYNGNLLPILFTKVKVHKWCIRGISKESIVMTCKALYKGEWVETTSIPSDVLWDFG